MRPPYRSILAAQPTLGFTEIQKQSAIISNADTWSSGNVPDLTPGQHDPEMNLPDSYRQLLNSTANKGNVILDQKQGAWRREDNGSITVVYKSEPNAIQMDSIEKRDGGFSAAEIYENNVTPEKSYQTTRTYDAAGLLQQRESHLRNGQDSILQDFDKGRLIHSHSDMTTSQTDLDGRMNIGRQELDVSYDVTGHVQTANGNATQKTPYGEVQRQITVANGSVSFKETSTKSTVSADGQTTYNETAAEKIWQDGRLTQNHLSESERTGTDFATNDRKVTYDQSGKAFSLSVAIDVQDSFEHKQTRIEKTRVNDNAFHRSAQIVSYHGNDMVRSDVWEVEENANGRLLNGSYETVIKGRQENYSLENGKFVNSDGMPGGDPSKPPIIMDEATEFNPSKTSATSAPTQKQSNAPKIQFTLPQ